MKTIIPPLKKVAVPTGVITEAFFKCGQQNPRPVFGDSGKILFPERLQVAPPTRTLLSSVAKDESINARASPRDQNEKEMSSHHRQVVNIQSFDFTGPDVACPGPDVAHIPNHKKNAKRGREYFLFTAAEHGCLPCVAQLVEKEKVNVGSKSKSCKYTALDFAQWFEKHGANKTGCADVVSYLKTHMDATAKSNKKDPGVLGHVQPSVCPGPGIAHIPTRKAKAKQTGKEYFLFTAAEHGCLACVRQLVEEEGVSVDSQSLSCKYTALDFAEWFQKKK